jgi:hypothetical protein
MDLSSPIDSLLLLPSPPELSLLNNAKHKEHAMGHDYFVSNPGNDTSCVTAAATTRNYPVRSGAPQKISLTLANLPKRRDNAGATWPRTPSKIDPQVSHLSSITSRVSTPV